MSKVKLNEHVGHYVPGMMSITIPVLELHRRWNYRHRLKRPRGLRDLMDDLMSLDEKDMEIIVVCNDRDDDLARYVQGNQHISKWVINSTNVGVSRAWNMGAMMAEGEFLCFVNDDVEIGRGALSALRSILVSSPEVGEVGPQGGMFSDRPGRRCGLEHIEEAEEVSGYLFATKRTVFDQVGGFDVQFTPAGFEEIDFSFRVRELGYKCFVVPGLNIRHHNEAGVSVVNGRIDFLGKSISREALHDRNQRLFCSKWSIKKMCDGLGFRRGSDAS